MASKTKIRKKEKKKKEKKIRNKEKDQVENLKGRFDYGKKVPRLKT